MKIDFSFDTQYGSFSDALHLPDDHTFTDAEIEAMKQQRLDNWTAAITAPPPEDAGTIEMAAPTGYSAPPLPLE